METARSIHLRVVGLAAILICSTFSVVSAQVATILCADSGTHPVELKPRQSFVLNCVAPYNYPSPPDFHTHACPTPGATCEKGEPYSKLFPRVANHVWVYPQDSIGATHTWTAPASGLSSTPTLFSVGCRNDDTPTPKYCAVDVTVSSSIKTVASVLVVAVCSLASLALL